MLRTVGTNFSFNISQRISISESNSIIFFYFLLLLNAAFDNHGRGNDFANHMNAFVEMIFIWNKVQRELKGMMSLFCFSKSNQIIICLSEGRVRKKTVGKCKQIFFIPQMVYLIIGGLNIKNKKCSIYLFFYLTWSEIFSRELVNKSLDQEAIQIIRHTLRYLSDHPPRDIFKKSLFYL